MGSEGTIQAAILTVLKQRRDIHAYRVNSGKVKVKGGWMQLAPEGTADIGGYVTFDWYGLTMCVPLAIEVKKPKEAPSDIQTAFLADILASGGVAFWTDTADGVLDRVDQQLDAIRGRLTTAARKAA